VSSPEDRPPGEPSDDDGALRRKAARGSIWALTGNFGGQALRFIGNLILTRLLAREAFGVMLLVNALMQGINLFSDVGIGPAIIQNRREDDTFLNTAWTIQVIRGVSLTIIATAIAWPFAVVYEQPVLLGLVPFAGLTAALNGFRSTRVFTANRELAISKLTILQLGSRGLGLAVTLAWAVVAPSVWALAGGAVAAALGSTVLSHTMLPGLRNRLTWDREAARALFKFGKWVFISTLLGFLAMQSDRLVFGKLVPIDELGVYAIAVLVATAPQMALRHIALNVNFPLYAQTVRDEGDLPTVFRRGRKRLLVIAGFISAAMIAAGPTAIDLLYEDEYAAAGWMVQILGAAMWFNILEVTIEAVLLALGETRKIAAANLVKVVLLFVLMPAGFYVAGFAGALAGFAIAEVFRYVGMGLGARGAGLAGLRQELGYTAMVVVTGPAAFGAALAVRGAGLHLLVEAAVLAVVGVASWAPVLVPSLRRR
jgi:O-antigen/teichoic acid export membrane protein